MTGARPRNAPSVLAEVDVLVVGAGQAGLSTGYHLQRAGFRPPGGVPAGRSYLVLDGEHGPGGAWRHRWRSLRMSTVNGVHDLPGSAMPVPDPCEPASTVVPDYYARYEEQWELAVLRPVRVAAVRDDAGVLHVESDAGTLTARALVNATGTWTKPFWPLYPGQHTFRGRQLHTADYRSADELAGRHVVVVGGGISAVQLLVEIAEVATTTWVTRRPPVFREDEFTSERGREAVAMVEARVRAGLPPQSVVSVTGLPWTPALREAAARGVLERRPMFREITPDGVRWSDGEEQQADVLLWCTGFRAALDHLAPLRLREPGGGIRLDGTRVVRDPRVHLVGYGPSASTVGANRAGRTAVRQLVALLDEQEGR